MSEMTWMRHDDIELPSYVTTESFEELYGPKGMVRVDVDLALASRALDRPVVDPGELTADEVVIYLDAVKRKESAEKAASTRRAQADDDKSPAKPKQSREG